MGLNPSCTTFERSIARLLFDYVRTLRNPTALQFTKHTDYFLIIRKPSKTKCEISAQIRMIRCKILKKSYASPSMRIQIKKRIEFKVRGPISWSILAKGSTIFIPKKPFPVHGEVPEARYKPWRQGAPLIPQKLHKPLNAHPVPNSLRSHRSHDQKEN